jgi:hypothetical protein
MTNTVDYTLTNTDLVKRLRQLEARVQTLEMFNVAFRQAMGPAAVRDFEHGLKCGQFWGSKAQPSVRLRFDMRAWLAGRRLGTRLRKGNF